MTDDEVVGILRDARQDEAPPAGAEAETIAALRAAGLVGPRRRGGLWTGLMVGAVAASLLVGVWIGRAQRVAIKPAGPLFLLLLYEDAAFTAAHQAEFPRLEAEYTAWARSVGPAAHTLVAEKLAAGGTEFQGNQPALHLSTARGPDQPDGFFLIEAPDEDAAVAIAQTCPHLRYGGRVILRTIPPN